MFANLKLSGMDTDGNAPCARCMIISRQCLLTSGIELAFVGQCQRMGWNYLSLTELCGNPFGRQWIFRHQYLPSRVSKCVGLPRLGPPRLTHSAIQPSIVSSEVGGGPSNELSFEQSPIRDVSFSWPEK